MKRRNLSEFPELFESFHPKLNKKSINEYERKQKVWWRCKENHEWQASISTRSTLHKGKLIGCPYCSHLRVSEKNSLLYSYPKVAKIWDVKKNKEKIENISKANRKKYWWICEKGHSFESSVGILTSEIRKTICPLCSGYRPSKENNLAIKFPDLIKEWDYTKNKNPELYLPFSAKRVWWICKKRHQWEMPIDARTRQNQNCPYCSNRRAHKDNDLYNYPNLIKEWNWKKNKNLKPNNFPEGSHKKAWWICKKGHIWKTVVRYRTLHGTGCPKCAGYKMSSNYDLLISNYSRLQKKEWNWEKNGDLDPKKFKAGSNKKVWWICQNKHEWKASIGSRTGRGGGCPKCSNQTSKPEMRIISELESIFDNVKSRIKISKYEIDIFIEDIKLGIEFDGYLYHKDSYNKDRIKSEFFKNKNINLLRVRSAPLKKIQNQDVIIKRKSDILIKNDINKIFKSIICHCNESSRKKINNYLKEKQFKNESLYRKYLSYYPSPLPPHSLKTKFPEISKEWDYKKNHPLRPQNFYPATSSRVWWVCKNNHSFDMPVAWRTVQNQGCPYCSGRRVNKNSNFAVFFPDIAKEWNWKKNGKFKPEDFSKRSGKSVWWICEKGHEWIETIHDRTNPSKEHYCPKCRKNEKLLSKKFPKIAKQWHNSKNEPYKVVDFKYGSGFNAWWFCDKCNKVWKASINSRTMKQSNCNCES